VEDELYARDPGLGAGLLRRLRENGIVNIHIDAALSNEVVYLPMLHLSWPVPVGFLRLSELSGAPLVPMQCLGDSDGFEVRFGTPVRFTGRSSADASRQRLQPLVERLEGWILEHPAQWEIWTRLDRYEKANDRS
jgi:lauroyl/myristoyl acyltransferase